MEGIPTDVIVGLPAGAIVMMLVAVLERAKVLPNQFAGIGAIVIATALGTAGLYLMGGPLAVSAFKAFIWGCMIVIAHSSIVDPITLDH